MMQHTPQHPAASTLAGLILAALLAGCGAKDQSGKPAGPGAAPPPAEVDVISVRSGPVTQTQDLPGRLQAYRTAQVRARVEGVVEKRLFTEGSDVKAGQPLYQIYIGNYSNDYEAARADATLAQENLERAKLLLEAKVVSQQEYEQTAARAKQAEAALGRARENWQNTRVPAPISGRIGRSLVTEGALVGRGEATLLTTIEQTNKLYVNFTQSEADIMQLRRAVKNGTLAHTGATRIELVLDDGSLYPLPGKLLFTDMAADPSTGSVSMRAEIPNPEGELMPGMFVTVRFPEAVNENAISVPQRAVQMNAQGPFVTVIDADSKASPRPVKLGSMAGGDFVIESGLRPGEQVIVNGLQKARPGTVVKPVLLEPEPAASPAKNQE
ncbi:MAG TPA: efflux RND transporter periplasmic adaptor subunit [Gallionella sp.]